MNPSLSLTSGASRSVTGLRQAVLNALPEALFLVDSATGELAPLNAAADRWKAAVQAEAHDWNLVDLLPECKLSSLAESISGFALNRAFDPVAGSLRDVMLHLYPLTDAKRELATADDEHQPTACSENSQLVVLGLRPVGHILLDQELPRRDAFDDAFHDPLTRLPNRRLFQRRLERIIERASRSSHHFAVLFVDLDRFKSINDQYGHIQGDKLLVTAAQRLVQAVRPQDMVARRDGDEFTILLDDLDQPEDSIGVAQRIIEHLQLPLTVDEIEGNQVTVGASVGIATAADGLLTAEELIARADEAMYQAKALGGSVYWSHGQKSHQDEVAGAGKKPLPR